MHQGNIGMQVLGMLDSITVSSKDEIMHHHDIENMRVMWFVPFEGDEFNSLAFVYYYDQPRWTVFDGNYTNISSLTEVRSLGTGSKQLFAGTYAGDTRIMDVGFLDGSTGSNQINAYYTTPWIDFNSPEISKRSLWLDVMYGDIGSAGVDIELAVDLIDDWTTLESIKKTFAQQGSRWDSAIWDTAVWDETGRAFIRYEARSLANLIRLRFISEVVAGFEVLGWRIESRLKGTRA